MSVQTEARAVAAAGVVPAAAARQTLRGVCGRGERLAGSEQRAHSMTGKCHCEAQLGCAEGAIDSAESSSTQKWNSQLVCKFKTFVPVLVL
jgi:hypothetical protein